MPIYEYTCDSCRHDFELLIRNGDRPACPDCGTAHLTKRFSVPAAHTSGSTSSLPIARRNEPCGAPSCCRGQCEM